MLLVILSFIFREKKRVKIYCENDHDATETALRCIGVDGKIDGSTLTYVEDGNNNLKKISCSEHHLTITNEPGIISGMYLDHVTLPQDGNTALTMAEKVFVVINDYESVDHLQAVLVDNTVVNTGWKGGLISQLEKLIGRSLHTIGCTLHLNELPLRKLFKLLDGSSTSPDSFSGPIGKMLSDDIRLTRPQRRFKKVTSPLVNFPMEQAILMDLSSDQRILYEYSIGVSTGSVREPWINWKIGPLHHARWLTLAARLLGLYVRTTTPSKNLSILVNYIQNVYSPVWFKVKISSKLADVPKIIYEAALYIHKQDFQVLKEVFFDTMEKSCFVFLPENFIYCMLTSSMPENRSRAIKIIKGLRKKPPSSLEHRKKIPQILWMSSSWENLVDVDNFQYNVEPPCTQHLDVRSLKDAHKIVPIFPAHSQSVERAVKLVSQMSRSVYGYENRHRSLLALLKSRELRPPFESRGHYSCSYDDFL